jgi:hypothetical protein
MRKALLSCAAVSLLLPTSAWAEGGCPEKITADLVTALGEAAGALDDGQTVYQPAGLTMLGASVSYVVAMRQPGKDPIEELDYRLGKSMRKYSERYPLDLRKAFDQAYSGSKCGGDKVTSCSIAFQSNAAAGRLAGVQLGEGSFEVPAGASGAAIPLVKEDFASDDQGPMFLVCLYDTD